MSACNRGSGKCRGIVRPLRSDFATDLSSGGCVGGPRGPFVPRVLRNTRDARGAAMPPSWKSLRALARLRWIGDRGRGLSWNRQCHGWSWVASCMLLGVGLLPTACAWPLSQCTVCASAYVQTYLSGCLPVVCSIAMWTVAFALGLWIVSCVLGLWLVE